jgi:hypothetical protein
MDRSVHATKTICIFISKRQQAPTLIGGPQALSIAPNALIQLAIVAFREKSPFLAGLDRFGISKIYQGIIVWRKTEFIKSKTRMDFRVCGNDNKRGSREKMRPPRHQDTTVVKTQRKHEK